MAIHTFFILLILPSLAKAVCNDLSNVCHLDNQTFKSANGYDCFQTNQQEFICTCFGSRFTINTPCRCTTTQICGTGSNFLGCREKDNGGYDCLCKTEKSVEIVENKPCGSTIAVTTTTTQMTTTSTHQPQVVYACLNDGVQDLSLGICHCPSGFSGYSCERFDLERVCDRIVCKNGATCTYGRENGTYYSRCVCPIGFHGEYCENKIKRGTCGGSSYSDVCNGSLCTDIMENDGQSYFKCAYCQPGPWTKICDDHPDMPRCQNELDRLIDPHMHEQGKYFQCGHETRHGYVPISRASCPKGLRYNKIKNLCVFPEYA